MKVLKTEHNQETGKEILTIELTPDQANFVKSVGLVVLVQQGAMSIASSELAQAAFGEPEQNSKDITPPEDASRDE